jgi:hypothetical protein
MSRRKTFASFLNWTTAGSDSLRVKGSWFGPAKGCMSTNYLSAITLREQASGRGDKSLNEESALLKRAQRHNYDLKNAVLEASTVRIEDIHPAWSRVILAVINRAISKRTFTRRI